jgi:hypothetical protein
MNYKTIIALCGFGILFITGLLLIVGTLLKWKPLINPKEGQWLFSIQYMDRNFFGLPFVIIHNIVMGLILILISLSAFLMVFNK